jgi:hypothetical protein
MSTPPRVTFDAIAFASSNQPNRLPRLIASLTQSCGLSLVGEPPVRLFSL